MTTSPLDRLHSELAALTDVWAQAQTASGGAAGGAARSAGAADQSFSALSGPGLVRVVEGAARLKRAVEAFLARAGDEVATRSAPEYGAESLAKRHGHSTPARLVAAATGGTTSEASQLLQVGAATRARVTISGAPLPAKFAHVRAGLDAGTVSVEAAALITRMLSRVEFRAEADVLASNEARLVHIAAGQPLSLVARAVNAAEARLDTGKVAETDTRLYAERSLTFREDSDGVFHLRARLDPVTAAPIKAALDAFVSDAFRSRGSRGSGGSAEHLVPSPVIDDRRSIPQLHADAIAALARHALGCQAAPGSLPSTTIVVRMNLESLRDGLGIAEIDGVDRPIAAATVRKLAADAELIPAVLGTDSVPLDLGRRTRLFSRSQRLALMERDGGCASCGANITYAEAHHVDWWSNGGPTDLANGVMLCAHCHHQIHDQGWEVRVVQSGGPGQVWFVPPPHLDPHRAPRLGGKARFSPEPVP
jgi:hypothetical protein